MLRQVPVICRAVYTCTCVVKPSSSLIQNIKCIGIRQHNFHTSSVLQLDKEIRDKKIIKFAQESRMDRITPTIKELAGEVDYTYQGLDEAGILIPTLETHEVIIDGQRYADIPVMNIRATPNNTLICLTSADESKIIVKASCGTEGFRNIKKTTTVAAQATGLSIGIRAMKRGIKQVRVVLNGVGYGRLPAIKGMESAGLNIISLTDRTPVKGPRPRKVRRL